jgi:hypothetical protein
MIRKAHDSHGKEESDQGEQPALSSAHVAFRFRSRFQFDYALVLAALLISLTGFLFGERIQAGGGLGMDGQRYGAWARDFYHAVFIVGLDNLSIQRILPSAVIHYFFRLFSISPTDLNIIRAFGFLNVSLITLSALTWCLIARELKISRGGKFLGFVGLFVNFAIMKWPSYYPVLTDIPAFFISILMLYSYLTNKKVGLLVLTALGAFVWFSLVYQGLLLLIFPRDKRINNANPAPYRLNLLSATVVAIIALLYMRHLVLTTKLTLPAAIEPMYSLIHLSIAAAVLYLLFALSRIWDWDGLFNIKRVLRRIVTPDFALALLVFLSIKFLQGWLSSTQSPLGIDHLFYEVTSSALAKPAVFYVAHVMFYGPILILALFLWKPVSRLIHQYGIGLILCITMGLIMGLNSESRHVFNFFPLIIPFVVKVVDARPLGLWHHALFALLSILFSKVWLIIGGAPIYGDPNRFSDQLYYMNDGPYMSNDMYSIQATAVIIAGILLYVFYVKRGERPVAENGSTSLRTQ